ncbi:Nitrogenase molybdenum-iron protein beta chain, partial [termite gut metagenome]
EPMDIASSNFSEETTVFGGNRNFNTGIDNIISQYHPRIIGIASTCLSETIGEDVQRLINEYKGIHAEREDLPVMVYASTPSYMGTHYEGFHEAVYATVKVLAEGNGIVGKHINLFGNFISPEDIRHLKEIVSDFGIEAMLFPDYSDTLDGTSWDTYHRIPEGGTPIEMLKKSAQASLSVELGYQLPRSASEYLRDTFNVDCYRSGFPVGIGESDKFFCLLSSLSGTPIPEKYKRQRGRLIDLYIDGHKYVSGKKAVIYGEEDLVFALTAFASEIGINPVSYITSGDKSMSFDNMETLIKDVNPDLMIGNSKGYYLARKIGIPLVRTGFPIHDRIGAQHIRIMGYEGTTLLFEQIVNTLLDDKQRKSTIGYKYM